MSDDVGLVRAAQHDPTMFGPLYQRYRHRIFAYLRTRSGNDDDAADLTQLVFLRALDGLHLYNVRQAPFSAWLFRIARNAAIDFHRQHRQIMAWDLVPDELHPLTEEDLEAGVLRQEDRARLRALLDALDTQTRELLALRFVGRLTITEIAAILGKSEAATQKKLHRTIQALQGRYHDHTR